MKKCKKKQVKRAGTICTLIGTGIAASVIAILVCRKKETAQTVPYKPLYVLCAPHITNIFQEGFYARSKCSRVRMDRLSISWRLT